MFLATNHRRIKSVLLASTGLLALVAITGCSFTPAPKILNIYGEASPMINLDAGGKPLSVVVRVYQLKNATEFSRLTFDSVASGRSDAELLGQDLLEKEEAILVPGTKYTNTGKIRDDTKFIGIVAFFRQPDQHYWRYLVDAEQARSLGLTFKIQDCYLSLTSPKLYPIPGQPANVAPVCEMSSNKSGKPVLDNAHSGKL